MGAGFVPSSLECRVPGRAATVASDPLGNTIRRTLFQLPGGESLPDAPLLERFVATHDPFAFAELVRRHGPMVLRTCQRVLRHHHDAEDAFQATFILLARKAGKIGQGNLLGGWLYRVACRVALDARAMTGKRRAVERQFDDARIADSFQAAESASAAGDVRQVLDEELGRLPEKYRLPVVLCYLEGKTNDEAARALGLPVGTLKFRLSRARDRLQDRLQRRGLALSAGAFAAVLAQETVMAALPAALVGNLVQAAKLAADGQAIAEGLISSQALLWAEAARVPTKIKLKLLLAVVLAALLASGTAAVKWKAPAAPRPTAAAPAAGSGDEFHVRWRFDDGLPRDIAVLNGKLGRNDRPAVGKQLGLFASWDTTLRLPTSIPKRPFVLSFKHFQCMPAVGSNSAYRVDWMDGRYAYGRHGWYNKGSIKWGGCCNCYFQGRWMVQIVESSKGTWVSRVSRWEKPYPGDKIGFRLMNVVIEEIELRGLRPDEIPPPLRTVEKTIQTMDQGPIEHLGQVIPE
jgi:RNA polymerase sigma factor (sigma-70 family)